jgi:hypothetical protein
MRSCAQDVRASASRSSSATRASGKPLDATTRAFFEPRFGHDFSSVRVHADPHATRAIAATAFTSGDQIVVRDEAATNHRALLAHELSHVVQQREGPVMPGMSARGDAGERGADRAAEAVMRGGYARVEGTAHAVQRGGWFDPVGEELRPIVESAKHLTEAKKLLEDPAIDEETKAQLRTLIARAERDIAIVQGKASPEVAEGSSVAALGAVGFAGISRTAGTQLVTKPSPWTVAAGLLLLGAAWIATTRSGSRARDAAIRDLGTTLRDLGTTIERAVAKPRPVAPPVEAPPVTEAPPETAKFPAPQPAPKPAPAPKPGQRFDPIAPPIHRPDPDTDDDERRGCRGSASGQRGSNTCHDKFATFVSGTKRDWDVVSKSGEAASFDGRGTDKTLYEVKTEHGFLLNTDESTRAYRERRLAAMQEQAARQQRIANECGYNLIWVFNRKAVRDYVDGFIEPKTQYRKFPCKKKSDEGELP